MRPSTVVLLGLIGAGASGGAVAARPFGGASTQPRERTTWRVGRPPQEPLPSLTPFQTRRTERLLRDRFACLGCHRLGDEGGQIGPPLDDVGERLSPERLLSMIVDPAGTLPGTRMPPQPLPPGAAERVAAYLLSRGNRADVPTAATGGEAAVPGAPPAGPTDGAGLYARHCAACHGERGDGDGWNAPDLPVPPTAHSDPELMGRRPDDSLFDAIFAGGRVLDRSPRMPAFGGLLTPSEIRALVAHIRDLCACEAPAWSRDDASGR